MIMKYKGYAAKVEPDEESGMIFGKVIDTNDIIIFHGATVPETKKAFQESIDLYLLACEKRNRKPNKPFNGIISYRTNPTIHRKLSVAAARNGLSVNQLVDQLVRRGIRRSGTQTRRAEDGETILRPEPDMGAVAKKRTRTKSD